jgi:hypothetical protein
MEWTILRSAVCEHLVRAANGPHHDAPESPAYFGLIRFSRVVPEADVNDVRIALQANAILSDDFSMDGGWS